MKNLKIFPKMFLQTFGILGTVIVLIHLLVFFIFPRTYLETRKQELYAKADEISNSIQGKDRKFVEQSLEFYSKSSDIKALIKGQTGDDELQVGDDLNVNLKSGNNSLINRIKKRRKNIYTVYFHCRHEKRRKRIEF